MSAWVRTLIARVPITLTRLNCGKLGGLCRLAMGYFKKYVHQVDVSTV